MRIRVLLVCAVLLAGAGCARAGQGTGGSDTGGSGTGTASGTGTDMAMTEADDLGGWCDAQAPGASPPARRPLPAGFAPVSASRCVFTLQLVKGDGEWQVRQEQQATGGLDALVKALRKPSQEDTNASCPAIGYAPIVITLTDARGRSVTPDIPRTVCGAPRPEVPKAIKALTWRTVKQTKVQRVRTQLEIDSGCSGGWKPVIAIDAAEPTRRSPALGPVFTGTRPTMLRVCRFALDSSETIGLSNGPPLAIGKLTGAGELTGTALTRFLDALAAAPGAGPCTKPQAPFAVLSPKDGGTFVAVELGGCYRFEDGNGNLRQLDAATVALLR
jgi:hypothetical protein